MYKHINSILDAMIHATITVVYFIANDVFFIELIDGDRIYLLKVLLPGIDTYTQGKERERERKEGGGNFHMTKQHT